MTSMIATATDFDGFYHAHYGDTVAMTYGFTADLSESQDIAQEAFARAWQRWRVISQYDQPASWVRRVATNLALSRWRKVRVASTYLVRQRAEDLPELTPDHVDLVAALRTLPVSHRKAVVLHYLVDLPVEQVAVELGVSGGTVKGWLHRGRRTLATELGDEVRRTVSPPPAAEVRGNGERGKQRRRSLVAATLAFVVVLAVITGFQLLGRAGNQPPIIPTVPSSSPSPSPSAIALKPAPAAPAACVVKRLPLPAGHGPASYLSGGDPTGRYLIGSSNDTNVYVWEYGKLIASPKLDGNDDSMLRDINSSGIAVGVSLDNVGYASWLYRNRKFTRLAGYNAETVAINEHNVIVGTIGNRQPAIWRTPESQPEPLPLPAGHRTGQVTDISEEGLIVGMAYSPTRPPGQNRAIVWHPDGTTTELMPPVNGKIVDFVALRIRGDWVVGHMTLNGKQVSLRWNLRTGKSEVIPELASATVVNEHGWIGTAWNRLVIRTDKGKEIPLPNNIPGIANEKIEGLWALSDDGRTAGGTLTVRNNTDFPDTVAVRWTCN